MTARQQLEELTAWTKQAGHWLNENQPRLARVTDPIMARTSANLGYLMATHEFVEATQAPPLVQAALYSAAGVGMHKWNEIVVSEINRALNEYNSRQDSGDPFNWLKSGLLIGTASLAISTGSTYFDSENSGTMFSGEQVEYVEQSLVPEPVNETFTEIIFEPTGETEKFHFENQDQTHHHKIISDFDLSDLVGEELPEIVFEDIEKLKLELEQTFERQSLLEKELHPRAEKHYQTISQGYNRKATIRKFERAREHDDLFKAAADKYDIPYTTMFSLAINESAGEKRAKSYAGARGLMQITPSTGKYIAKLMGKKFSKLTGRST